MAAGGATGGVLVWDSCCERVNTAVGEGRPTADLRNNGHEYGIPVCHLSAYPDGSFFISADSTTLKVNGLNILNYLGRHNRTEEYLVLVARVHARPAKNKGCFQGAILLR